MKGVFEISGAWRDGATPYDDVIDQHYQFPRIYLRAAEACLGDWIIYRETGSDGGRKAYIAVARLAAIDPDSRIPYHYYGRVADFLLFDKSVPYRDAAGRFAERFLREGDPAKAGRALQGRSVRTINSEDFVAIVDAQHLDVATAALLADPPSERRVEQMLVNRKIRDAAVHSQVLSAYSDTCAVTRLRIINGGGKAEAQAAHIWSVADGGPDVVQNGLALSATAHWLFDRHLISLTDEYDLLVLHNKVPTELSSLFPVTGKPIRRPADRPLWPRLEFMARHRERFAGV